MWLMWWTWSHPTLSLCTDQTSNWSEKSNDHLSSRIVALCRHIGTLLWSVLLTIKESETAGALQSANRLLRRHESLLWWAPSLTDRPTGRVFALACLDRSGPPRHINKHKLCTLWSVDPCTSSRCSLLVPSNSAWLTRVECKVRYWLAKGISV